MEPEKLPRKYSAIQVKCP